MTPLEKRAERKARNKSLVDMNLVSLIDVFTILIFFLLSNSTEVETLPSPRAVKLPESTAEQSPKETLVIVISGKEIIVDGRKVADVADVLKADGDLIEPLKAELDVLSKRVVVKQSNQSQTQAITLMGDREIPYQLLRKVMVTCARANYVDVSFAVRTKVES